MKLRILTSVLIFLVLGWIAIMSWIAPGDDLSLSHGDVYDYNTGWQYIDRTGEAVEVTLPVDLDIPIDTPLSITRKIDEEFPSGQSLLIRASLQSLTIWIDGELYYQKPIADDGIYQTPSASAWHIVKLPDDVAGSTIVVQFISNFKPFSGCLNDIVYGNGIDCMYHIFKEYRFGFFLDVIIAFIGFIMIIISIMLKHFRNRSWLYLGLFSLSIATWLFAESRMIQFFTGNQMLVGGVAYMSIAIMPIPILLYLKEEVLSKYSRLINGFVLAFIIDFSLITVLQLTGTFGFFQTAPVSLALIAIVILIFILLLSYEAFRNKNTSAKRFLIFISVFALFASIEIVQFYFRKFDTTSHFLRYGILLFILMIAIDMGKRMKDLVLQHREAELYKKMAYQDILTGGMNRSAFERDIDNIRNQNSSIRVRIVMFDLNGLKYINDTFGHDEGDRAIKSCFECMTKIFSEDAYCYRFGGDEFVCVMLDDSLETFLEKKESFIHCISLKSNQMPYPLSVAIGSAVYANDSEEDFPDFFRRMDRSMYDDKRHYKTQTEPHT